MDSSIGAAGRQLQFTSQVVAIPYPGRGHINPMMNFCELVATRRPDILITFIVTEEWYGFIGSESRPQNIRFGRITNAIPSEIGRGKDFQKFADAVMAKMGSPVEEVLDRLEPPFPSVILYDTFLSWVLGLAEQRNIPTAGFWSQSATIFTVVNNSDVLIREGHMPFNQSFSQSDEMLAYIPGIPSICVQDLPRVSFDGLGRKLFDRAKDTISMACKGKCIVMSSIQELESQVIEALNQQLPRIPIYAIGPAIPYFKSSFTDQRRQNHKNTSDYDYLAWLDAQPRDSVLYISQGSFLSSSPEQLKEIMGGVLDSGVRFFMVARDLDDAEFQLQQGKGLVVPWCDQLEVLCHPSVGGFWSHCGWNSTQEGAYAGIPILTSPIIWDQFTNSKNIVEDWKMGWKLVLPAAAEKNTSTRQEISSVLKRFMDTESDEGKEIRRNAKYVREICLRATAEGGPAELAIQAFISTILK